MTAGRGRSQIESVARADQIDEKNMDPFKTYQKSVWAVDFNRIDRQLAAVRGRKLDGELESMGVSQRPRTGLTPTRCDVDALATITLTAAYRQR